MHLHCLINHRFWSLQEFTKFTHFEAQINVLKVTSVLKENISPHWPVSSSFLGYDISVSLHQNTLLPIVHFPTSWLPEHILRKGQRRRKQNKTVNYSSIFLKTPTLVIRLVRPLSVLALDQTKILKRTKCSSIRTSESCLKVTYINFIHKKEKTLNLSNNVYSLFQLHLCI